MKTVKGLIAIAFLQPLGSAAAQEAVTVEALWDVVQRQQAQILALEERLARSEAAIADAESSLATTEAALEVTGDAVEALAVDGGEARRTVVGGYGELHYNSLDADDPARDLDQIDFHRFVLFFGHRFNDRVSFFSELELEHSLAGDELPGEVELEQAYVRFQLGDQLAAQTGLFLVPVGIINETHEPPTFYGVERNDVESVIVPSTWWEAGGGFNGTTANGLGWDIAVHSGLSIPTAGGDAFRVRAGRQKVAEATASDWAATGRLKYTGLPGLELAGSVNYQSDPSQAAGDGLDSGRLITAHAIYQAGGFTVRGLYARWDFDGIAVEAAGVDRQTGSYLETSYRFGGPMNRWGVYGRFEDVEGARTQDRFSQNEIGFNYWATDAVTLKFTFRDREHDLAGAAGRDFSGIDLGFGYQL